MSEAPSPLKVEATRKSPWLAAVLNLVLPGAGYAYCGRWVLGVIAFLFVVGVTIATRGGGTIPVVLVLFADGFLVAGRYNKKLAESAPATGDPTAKAAQR